jgi:methionyl-tRNA synthetase
MLLAARNAMNEQQIHDALAKIWAVVAEANRYFASEAPWALAKTDPPRQKAVLYVTAEVLRHIAILAQPFIPQSASDLLDLLSIEKNNRKFATLKKAWLPPQQPLPAPKAIFPRYVEPKEPLGDGPA